MVKPNNLSKNAWSDRLIDRLAYAHDASMYRLVPEAVARPKSEQDVKYILRHANDTKSPVTFRTGGTSLSGQSISNGILAEVVRGWQNYHINDDGNSIELQPGVIGARANVYLAPYQKRIGPDPASINSCKIAGMAANNSSGMCCGVAQNSYHTLKDMTLIFADGTELNTADEYSCQRFLSTHSDWVNELMNLVASVKQNSALSELITHKYRLKNTTGYGLNALLDFSDPIDIIKHVIIGSEGTLVNITEAKLRLVPTPKFKGLGGRRITK